MHKKPSKTALITGATGGIGYEFCRLFAGDQINLVLVARNQQKLEKISTQLQDEFGIKTHIINLDLAGPDAAKKLHQLLIDQKLPIEFLVNNAGVGHYGQFSDAGLDALTNMLDLNIKALVQLTRLLLPDMIRQGSGHILNVASLAGFQPGGPNAAAYYASKSFVLAFNRALVVELKQLPITCTAFCPGPLNTAFVKQGNFTDTRLYRYFTGNTRKHVAKAYQSFLRGKATVVPGFANKLLAIGGEFPPRSIALVINNFLLQH